MRVRVPTKRSQYDSYSIGVFVVTRDNLERINSQVVSDLYIYLFSWFKILEGDTSIIGRTPRDELLGLETATVGLPFLDSPKILL